VIKYVASLVRATRPRDDAAPGFIKEWIDWGAGPRAGQFLIHAGKALAAMDARFSVSIEDVQKAAVPVLRHRLAANFQAQAEGVTTEDVINPSTGEVVARTLDIPVPLPEYRTDWLSAAAMALQFWERVAASNDISRSFRDIGAAQLQKLDAAHRRFA